MVYSLEFGIGVWFRFYRRNLVAELSLFLLYLTRSISGATQRETAGRFFQYFLKYCTTAKKPYCTALLFDG